MNVFRCTLCRGTVFRVWNNGVILCVKCNKHFHVLREPNSAMRIRACTQVICERRYGRIGRL